MVINSAPQNTLSAPVARGVWAHSHEGPPRNANVLVVEDDQGVRETTVAILREEGYVVVQAADGADALELLKGHDIDVLLLDLRLPRVDGPAVLEALDRPPTVVVVSGFESFEEAEMRRRFGPVLFDCLHKPVSPHRLMAATAAAVDHALAMRLPDPDRPVSDSTDRRGGSTRSSFSSRTSTGFTGTNTGFTGTEPGKTGLRKGASGRQGTSSAWQRTDPFDAARAPPLLLCGGRPHAMLGVATGARALRTAPYPRSGRPSKGMRGPPEPPTEHSTPSDDGRPE